MIPPHLMVLAQHRDRGSFILHGEAFAVYQVKEECPLYVHNVSALIASMLNGNVLNEKDGA